MRTLKIALLLMALGSSVGCTTMDKMMHELKPHRLWRFNRHPAPGRADSAFYSVSDPIAERQTDVIDEKTLLDSDRLKTN